MKRLVFLCAATLAAASLAQAQLNPIWVKYHNVANLDDYGTASAIDGAGNVYMTGSSTNVSGQGVIFLTKLSPNGTKLWTRTYSGGGGGPDYGWVVEVDAAGNAIVAGDSVGVGTGYDLVTLKYDPAGNPLWVRRYNGPGNGDDGVFAGRSLGVDPLGNVVVGGYSTGAGSGYDWVVIKYSSTGALNWLRTINGTGNGTDACWGIAVDAAGEVYAGGDVTNASRDLLAVKYDAGGEIVWKNEYDGPAGGAEWFYQLDVDSSGNVALAATSDGIGTRQDYLTLAYDANGAELFAARYDGPSSLDEIAFAVAISDAGLIATTGLSDNDIETSAATVLYNLQGNQLWVQRYDEESYYYGHDEGDVLRFDANGDLLMVAWGWSGPEAGFNTSVVRYSAGGLVLDAYVFDGAVHGDEYGGGSLSLDGNGNVYVPGSSQRGARHLDAALLKLGPGAPASLVSNGELPEDGPLLFAPEASPIVERTAREVPYRPGFAHRLPRGVRMAPRE